MNGTTNGAGGGRPGQDELGLVAGDDEVVVLTARREAARGKPLSRAHLARIRDTVGRAAAAELAQIKAILLDPAMGPVVDAMLDGERAKVDGAPAAPAPTMAAPAGAPPPAVALSMPADTAAVDAPASSPVAPPAPPAPPAPSAPDALGLTLPKAHPGDKDAFPDTPGMFEMQPVLYQLTADSIKASRYEAVVEGRVVQRYRPLQGYPLERHDRKDRAGVYLFCLDGESIARVADHAGRIVDLRHGTVLVPAVFGVAPMAKLVGLGGVPRIELRPLGCSYDLEGREVWHFSIRVLVHPKRDADGHLVPRLVDRESLQPAASPAAATAPAPAAPTAATTTAAATTATAPAQGGA